MPASASCPARAATGRSTRLSPDTGRNETAGIVIVLRVYGPGQDRRPSESRIFLAADLGFPPGQEVRQGKISAVRSAEHVPHRCHVSRA